MNTYLPAAIWLVSGVICLSIARRRNVKQTAFKSMAVAIFGPIAIPWVLVAKTERISKR